MFKRVLLALVFFCVICFIALFGILYSSYLTQRVVAFVLHKNLKDSVVEQFSIGHQKFSLPGQLDLQDVSVRLKAKSGPTTLKIKQLQVHSVHRLLCFASEIPLYANDFTFETDEIRANLPETQATLNFNMWTLSRWQATIASPEIEAYKYKFTRVSAQLDGRRGELLVKNIRADFYKGQLNGQLKLTLAKQAWYQASFDFSGVDLGALKEADDVISKQLEGVINGDVSVSGDSKRIDGIELKVKVIKDGRLRASLLKFILPYIPRTEETQVLQQMIKKDLKVPVESADVEFKSIDSQKLSGTVHLGVKKLNLNLNLPVDVLFDGNIFGLIKRYQKLNGGQDE